MSEPFCQKCGRPYALREGEEPTPYCDRCAHSVVEELQQKLTTYEGKTNFCCECGGTKARIEIRAIQIDALSWVLEQRKKRVNITKVIESEIQKLKEGK